MLVAGNTGDAGTVSSPRGVICYSLLVNSIEAMKSKEISPIMELFGEVVLES
jgi:hypothetical protein